jgi:hypothetical protein
MGDRGAPFLEEEFVQNAYASRALEWWVQVAEAAEAWDWAPMPTAKAMGRLVDAQIHSLRPSDQIQLLIFPVFAQAAAAFEKMGANRACAKAMIEVILFRNRHGHFPETLEEAGVHALDPFDRKPLKYRVTEKGFRIYCVGNDGKDDGGLFYWERPKNEGSRRDEPIAVFPSWERLGPQ